MDRFTKQILVGAETRLFEFTRIRNFNGVKFFITTKDENKKPVSFSLKQFHGDWKLLPGSSRWLYDIESELAQAITDTSIS